PRKNPRGAPSSIRCAATSFGSKATGLLQEASAASEIPKRSRRIETIIYSHAMADTVPAKTSRRSLGGVVTFLLALGALGLAVFAYSLFIHERIQREELEARVKAWDPKFDKFKDAVRDVDRHLSSVVYQEIDVPGAGWQPIAGGFYVIDLGTAPHA